MITNCPLSSRCGEIILPTIMDFCGPYDEQLAAHYRQSLLTPLLAGWEFRERPALETGHIGWQLLAKKQDWLLTAPIRHDLLSDEWAIVVTDAEQIIQYVNPLFEKMTGYTNTEALGRRPNFLQGEGTSLLARQRMRKAIEKKRTVSELLLNYRKDRTAYWCNVVIRPITNHQKEIVNFIAFEKEVQLEELPADR
ncbi:putative PAS/PAC sensor protein [Spirosoma linguale DSM 74]|uniref:PAS/PAC sensor protein n=2 Tax=Spirosoma TaxID=107 RepID=D2QNI0_SPILD|nr:putative PAS/PAC sensor protein [Spirosoma linguale DSM 74]